MPLSSPTPSGEYLYPTTANGTTGKIARRGHIKFWSPPITLQVGCLHQERISFLVLEVPTIDIILGCPWLSQHSPEVRWDTSEILRWMQVLLQNCLSNVPVPLVSNPKLQVHSTVVESPEPREVPTIPSDYMAFQDVFSKQAATKLPPHRPWDCAIDLLPGV